MTATSPSLDSPYSVISDGAGGVYVASVGLSSVYRIAATGMITVIAGTGALGYGGDGGPAAAALLNSPRGLALDSSGNLYISDTNNNRVRRVAPDGTISTLAGTGVAGFLGDGGAAATAQLRTPRGLAVDGGGNLFIVDYGNDRIRKITRDGVINTIAGTGAVGFSGDGGPGVNAQISFPELIAVDSTGNLYFPDTNNHRIRRITPAGIVSTIAGTGTSGFSGDGGSAMAAQLSFPTSVAIDALGGLVIGDRNNQRVRYINSAGVISTIAGSGVAGFLGDGGAATSARVSNPFGVAVDSAGNIVISDFNNNRLRRVAPAGTTNAGTISTIAGNGTVGFAGDGGVATSAMLNTPFGVASDRAGNLLVADLNNNRIRRISPSGSIATMVGNGTAGFAGDGGQAGGAQLRSPSDVAVDSSGNIYIADSTNFRVRRITPDGQITTIAGRGTSGFSGDGGPATNAQFNPPEGIAVDGSGNIFIADQTNHRIRKVAPSGIVTTYAGTGTAGAAGDGGSATSAQLNNPVGVAVDALGNVFIADTNNHRVRIVDASGVISTLAGTGVAGFSGDGGPASAAQLNTPSGVAFDLNGNLLIADTNNSRIRRVTANGVITTIAGNGQAMFAGDGGFATAASLTQPRRITADASGNIFIADTGSQRIRELIPVHQSSITFAIPNQGAASVQTSGAASAPVTVGYGRVVADANFAPPSGFAIFGLRQNNVLISEASVPGSSLIRSGRIYAEIGGSVNTGLAIANPNDAPATISFFFTTASGDTGAGSMVIPPNGQIASFLDEAPFNGRAPISGTFTFNSSAPVCAIALRGLLNERGEFLITTLPVAVLGTAPAVGPSLFPHFADGGGWTTQIVLVNPTDQALSGTVQLRNPQGQNIIALGSFSGFSKYSIPPRSSVKLQTSNASTSTQTGAILVTPDNNGTTPSGVVVFSFKNQGVTVSEAGVQAEPAGTAFRVYAESLGNFGSVGSIRTGLAVANTSPYSTGVVVEVENLDGSTGLVGVISLPPYGQKSVFLDQIPGLEYLVSTFQGVLRLSSYTPFVVAGLRGRFNERNDLLITTTPPANENAPPRVGDMFFPHIVDAGGYSTQFVLLSGQPAQPASGVLRLYSQSGPALNLILR